VTNLDYARSLPVPPWVATEMALPVGKVCLDCVHIRQGLEVLGCTKPENRHCDFSPSKFQEKT
jgi:hypothetical protein